MNNHFISPYSNLKRSIETYYNHKFIRFSVILSTLCLFTFGTYEFLISDSFEDISVRIIDSENNIYDYGNIDFIDLNFIDLDFTDPTILTTKDSSPINPFFKNIVYDEDSKKPLMYHYVFTHGMRTDSGFQKMILETIDEIKTILSNNQEMSMHSWQSITIRD